MKATRFLQFLRLEALLAEIAHTDPSKFPPGGPEPNIKPVGGIEPEFVINPKRGFMYSHHITPVNPDASLTPDMIGDWDDTGLKYIFFELQGTQGKFAKIYETQITREILGAFEVLPSKELQKQLYRSADNICIAVWRGMNKAYKQGFEAGRLRASTKNAFQAVKNPAKDPIVNSVAAGLGLSAPAVNRIKKVLDEVYSDFDNYPERMAKLSECFIKPQEFAYACFMLGAQKEREKNYAPGPEAFQPCQDAPQFPADMPLHVKQAITDFLEIAGDDLPEWMEAKIITGEIPICIVTI